MGCLISSLHYCPVKSLSFLSVKSCAVRKNIGIYHDRIFAFSRNIDFEKAKLIERKPAERKLNYFLTLKNSPFLNKYNFLYNNNKLILTSHNKELISISLRNLEQSSLLCDKLTKLENSLNKPIFLLHNNDFPFYDTTHSNNVSNFISLINLNSVADFEKKSNQKIEFERFRGNFYVDGIKPWEERNWVDKIITINNVSFKVKKYIRRCSATNLQPNTSRSTINLPSLLKKTYNHFDMGIYLTALNDGNIHIGSKVIIN